jgi:NAD(P)-dependent dehydrogenase (short-subunit alcohol dehydrogenase family)
MTKRKYLVTGTDRGLGFALTEAILGQGDSVFSCLYSTASDEMLALKEKYPDDLFLVEGLDIGCDESVAKAVEEVSQHTKTLDVIINNGAINPDNFKSKLEEIDFDIAQAVMNVNALGALRITKGFITHLRDGYVRTLINISSEAGSITQSYRITGYDYCMSKAALNMASSMLQTYLKPDGIKVLAIYPGWMQTEMGGPNAILAPSEVARKILDLIWTFHEQFNSYIFINNEGKKIEW